MTKNPPTISQNLSLTDSSTDFRSLLGEDWDRLHPDIQLRFSAEYSHRTITYKGIMREVSMSFAGRLLAHFCRLLGTPLCYASGKDVPTEVKVYPNSHLGGMTWDRFYYFANKKTNRVRSTKCIQAKCGLVEVAISGFGMYSKVYAKEGALVFESKRFFCTIAGIKIPIPHLLSPGKTIASQKALNDRSFEFTLHIQHPILGRLFYQVGVFTEHSQ